MTQDKRFWATICIVATWVAVGVSAVSGGEFEVVDGTRVTEIPAVWGVAAMAAAATIVLGYLGFRE